jgi:hypothetical protein
MSRCATSTTIDLPAKDSVELLTASRDLENALSLLSELMCSLEATSSGLRWSEMSIKCELIAAYLTLRQRVLDFVDLDLAEPLDLQQVAASGCVYGGDSVVAIGLELRDVGSTNAMRLYGINVDDVAVLLVRSARSVVAAVLSCSRHCVSRRWRLRKAC